jgi:hypothetical protein
MQAGVPAMRASFRQYTPPFDVILQPEWTVRMLSRDASEKMRFALDCISLYSAAISKLRSHFQDVG